MAAGETYTGSLTDALPDIVGGARTTNEYEGTWRRTCDVRRQTPGTGLNWTEFALAQLSAQDITETTENKNFQQFSGTLTSVEPTMTQIVVKVTDRTYRKVAQVVTSQFPTVIGAAMARLKDEDYLDIATSLATTNSPGSGTSMGSGYVASAVNNISSNVTEPAMSQIFTVLHGFQIRDIQDEITAGIGTYTVQGGMTEEVFRRGFRGTLFGSNLFEDGNISIDSTPNANGMTHAREGIICAIGMSIKHETDRDVTFGGGAGVISLVDEYAFAERQSQGTQVFAQRHQSDATAPTS